MISQKEMWKMIDAAVAGRERGVGGGTISEAHFLLLEDVIRTEESAGAYESGILLRDIYDAMREYPKQLHDAGLGCEQESTPTINEYEVY